MKNKSKKFSSQKSKWMFLLTFELFLFCLFFVGCRKEGPSGKAVIEGMVIHHAKPIPGSVVYIKYGAKESPGSDVTYYDESVTANDSANYKFADLRKGDYYLFAVGYDSAGPYIVTGGIPVEIKKKTETAQADVQVVE